MREYGPEIISPCDVGKFAGLVGSRQRISICENGQRGAWIGFLRVQIRYPGDSIIFVKVRFSNGDD
jgi:hypothetical protein